MISDSHSSIKILIPQKEFNFGKQNQVYSDCPQIRVSDPGHGTFKKFTIYRSLKSEEFVIVGCFKQVENRKQIEIPAPSDRVLVKEEDKKEEERPKPFMLEKPGFPPLKPIIPVSRYSLMSIGGGRANAGCSYTASA